MQYSILWYEYLYVLVTEMVNEQVSETDNEEERPIFTKAAKEPAAAATKPKDPQAKTQAKGQGSLMQFFKKK